MTGAERRQLAGTEASTTDGVISRDSLARLGLSYVDVRTEIRAGRWRCHGLQTVAVHNGPLGVEANRWRAIWETGIGVAVIDGVTALQVAGLRHYDDEVIHVSVVHTASVKKLSGTYLHKVIRRLPNELAPSGIPRTRPAVAELRAAFWARTDRQATLILLMVVQQRLATPLQLLEVSGQLRGRKRRRLVRTVIADAIDGFSRWANSTSPECVERAGYPSPCGRRFDVAPEGASTSMCAGASRGWWWRSTAPSIVRDSTSALTT